MTSRDSLDACFSDLVKEADQWANAAEYAPTSNEKPQTTSDDERQSEEKMPSADLEHHCFEDLTRAISSHITDMLMQRLKMEEKSPSAISYQRSIGSFPSKSGQRKGNGTQTPSRIPRPVSRSSTRPTSPSNDKRLSVSRVNGGTFSLSSSRYPSQNLLNSNPRTVNPPRGENETPLENRASRLRRVSMELKRNQMAVSANNSPMPQRRRNLSLSRTNNGRSEDQIF